MQTEMQTTSPQFPHDMTAWCQEKLENVVSFLAYHAETLSRLEKEQGPREITIPEINLTIDDWDGLHEALYDATKVLAYFCQANWSTSDRDLIINDGQDGYEQLAVKYGLLEKTSRKKEAEKFSEFITDMRELLSGPRSPNRTLMHDLIRKYPKSSQHKTILIIADSLEEVTMGRLDWPVFTDTAKSLLQEAGL